MTGEGMFKLFGTAEFCVRSPNLTLFIYRITNTTINSHKLLVLCDVLSNSFMKSDMSVGLATSMSFTYLQWIVQEADENNGSRGKMVRSKPSPLQARVPRDKKG